MKSRLSRLNPNRKIAGAVLLIILIVLGLLMAGDRFYVDFLWFRQMGYLNVFWKELLTKLAIGTPVFAILLVILHFYLRYLRALADRYTRRSPRVLQRSERLGLRLAMVLVALFIAQKVAAGTWNEWLLSTHSSGFGKTDPLYGLDLSFYFFTLPMLKALHTVLLSCFAILALFTLLYILYALYRDSDLDPGAWRRGPALGEALQSAGKSFLHLVADQLGRFAGIFFLLAALGLLIRLFEMVYGGTGMVFGAGASDIAVGRPVLVIGIMLCLFFAVFSVIHGRKGQLRRLAIGPVVLIAVMILGGITQSVYEYAAVVPNQYNREKPYIEKNIQATRDAYGLGDVTVKEYAPTQKITAADIGNNRTTIANIPINDQKPTRDMYNSLQGIRNYYKFDDVDVDRYPIAGSLTEVFVDEREMDTSALASDAKTWVNQHLKYTHGFGMAVSPVNKVNEVGQPELTVKNIPPQSRAAALKIAQPRIYFGEGHYEYCVVNAASKEFDYPKGDNNAETRYTGRAGIRLNFFNRLAFALYERSPEILFSSEISGSSRILIHRGVMDRIKTIAPFLAYNNDPYMTIVGGRLYWIADAFVKSDRYPYAKPYDDAGHNYLKNPVKVVVDAYNGDVTFYQVADEPVLNTYAKIFPGLVKSIHQMPRGLRAHLRYSKTVFDVQAKIYATYHMTNPQVFYNKEDAWSAAHQFYGTSKTEQAIGSNYQIMKLPDRQTEFMLTKPFTPRNKDNAIAWLAGVSDGDDYGRLLLYQFPKSSLVYGPMQVEQRIDQDTTISPQLTLLGQQGSNVMRGNLLMIPIEQGLIYVKPIYIQADSGDNNLPEVKEVIVCYQNKIVMADTLDDALAKIFDTNAAAGTATATETQSQSGKQSQSIKALVKQANTLYGEAIKAQQAGDWATYGEKIKALKSVLAKLSEQAK